MHNFILLQYIDSLVDQKLIKWKIRKVMENNGFKYPCPALRCLIHSDLLYSLSSESVDNKDNGLRLGMTYLASWNWYWRMWLIWYLGTTEFVYRSMKQTSQPAIATPDQSRPSHMRRCGCCPREVRSIAEQRRCHDFWRQALWSEGKKKSLGLVCPRYSKYLNLCPPL